jgi:hypothetical protein
MRSICFHCQFVGIGFAGPRCPRCSHPLIAEMTGAALPRRDLQRILERAPAALKRPPPLPGVSAEPRQAQLLIERRRARALEMLETKRTQAHVERRRARLRTLASLCAASAAVAICLLLTLDLMGAF